jgi:hypothetical protein
VIQVAQPLEHGPPDPVAGNFAAGRSQVFFDADHDCVDRVVVETAGPGVRDPGAQLRAIERLDFTRPLAHHHGDVLDPFIGRVAPSAHEALTAAPNRGTVLGQTRVDDLVVIRSAIRALHDRKLQLADWTRGRS